MAKSHARTRKTTLTKSWKMKIGAGVVAARFHKCFMGEVELTPTQLQAGKILFDRLEPTLERTELTGKNGADLIPRAINVNFPSSSG